MKVTSVISGYFKLDGGAMFGVVPKKLWQKLNPPDADNLCTWSMRSILIETGNRKILVDTGIGNKQSEKFRKMFYPHGNSVIDSFREMAIDPREITDVFLTHFHFDHVGGALKFDENGKIIPTFPNATYWSNSIHYDWAFDPNPREEASFLRENFVPLKEQGLLQMIDVQKDDLLWMDDINIRFVNGHTMAMMLLDLPIDSNKRMWYGADLIPSRWHIRRPYVLSYDVQPLYTLDEKERLLSHLVNSGELLFFEHDPEMECAEISKDDRNRFVIKKHGPLEEMVK